MTRVTEGGHFDESTENASISVFVWQFTATFRGRRLRAQEQLVFYLKNAILARGINQVLFTSVPNSAAERSVRSLARKVFSAVPRVTHRLPNAVSRREQDFVFSIKR